MAEDGRRGTRSKEAGGKARSAWPAFITAHDALVVRIEERLRAASLPDLSWYVVLWVLERAPEQRLRMHELADTAVIARSNRCNDSASSSAAGSSTTSTLRRGRPAVSTAT